MVALPGRHRSGGVDDDGSTGAQTHDICSGSTAFFEDRRKRGHDVDSGITLGCLGRPGRDRGGGATAARGVEERGGALTKRNRGIDGDTSGTRDDAHLLTRDSTEKEIGVGVVRLDLGNKKAARSGGFMRMAR